jgi:hypothetical protein
MKTIFVTVCFVLLAGFAVDAQRQKCREFEFQLCNFSIKMTQISIHRADKLWNDLRRLR